MITIRLFTLLFAAATGLATAAPPNLIFILSDDLAQGDLGVYGQKLIETPRLDRMAAEGTRFTQTYCGTSVCAPSRASLMTGLHSGHCPTTDMDASITAIGLAGWLKERLGLSGVTGSA